MSIFYKIILLASDIVLVNVAFLLALLLRFDFTIPADQFELYLHQMLMLTLIHVVINLGFKLYNCLLRYITTRELLYLCSATVIACGLFFAQGQLVGANFPRSVYVMYTALLLLMMILSRFSYKFINRILSKCSKGYNAFKDRMNGVKPHRVLILGGGDAASILVREGKKDSHPTAKYVAILDDDKQKWHSYLCGVPIRGSINDVEKYVEIYKADTIVVALPSAGKKRISEVLNTCKDLNCHLKIFEGISKAVSDQDMTYQVRQVSIEDLLGREEIVLKDTKVQQDIEGGTILVTGGGGSIGSELCRQISVLAPAKLVIFDIYENTAYDIQNELLLNGFPKDRLVTVIGSVRDTQKLDKVFTYFKPDIVFHAAAHKHVPLMEDNPTEAIKNNVLGTYNVAVAAREHKVRKFILISTDKAVNPTNTMGATKRLCELIIQSINPTTPDTDYVAVRFGNVLGSNGSVIPLFKRQLEAGGPLTVTHKDIIRYFMTIPEAVRLILQAMSFAGGGEIFVLDMGSPVKILDLAENFIKLSGFEPYKDIDIIFTGLRPGEKLYEELLMDEEGMTKTISDKIFIGKPSDITFSEIKNNIAFLQNALQTGDDIKVALSKVVTTYRISPEGCTDTKEQADKRKIS